MLNCRGFLMNRRVTVVETQEIQGQNSGECMQAGLAFNVKWLRSFFIFHFSLGFLPSFKVSCCLIIRMIISRKRWRTCQLWLKACQILNWMPRGMPTGTVLDCLRERVEAETDICQEASRFYHVIYLQFTRRNEIVSQNETHWVRSYDNEECCIEWFFVNSCWVSRLQRQSLIFKLFTFFIERE